MSDEKKLTVDDPISREVLSKLEALSAHRARLAERNLDLDGEKVRLMVAVRQIDQEHQKLFEAELIERGLTPTTPVEVDATTGKITVLKDAPPDSVAKPSS